MYSFRAEFLDADEYVADMLTQTAYRRSCVGTKYTSKSDHLYVSLLFHMYFTYSHLLQSVTICCYYFELF
jgi:hypothetical protein